MLVTNVNYKHFIKSYKSKRYFGYICKIEFLPYIMKHRIEYLIGELKMTNAKFAEEINVPKSIISHILTGRNKPSLEFATKILTRFENISPEWLILGKGNIFKSDNTENIHDSNNLFDNISSSLPLSTDSKDAKNKQQQSSFTATTLDKTENKQIITKQIKKIIVYYTDNTFEEFNK